MKMHDDLLAKILAFAEQNADDGETRCFPSIPCYTTKEIKYHLQLCSEAGFIITKKIEDDLTIIRLTYPGQIKLREFRTARRWHNIGL